MQVEERRGRAGEREEGRGTSLLKLNFLSSFIFFQVAALIRPLRIQRDSSNTEVPSAKFHVIKDNVPASTKVKHRKRINLFTVLE